MAADSRQRQWIVRGGALVLLLAFIGWSIWPQLSADWQTGAWKSLLIRTLLMGAGALLVTLRIHSLPRLRTLRQLQQVLLVLVFLWVIFFPLVSQLSYLGKSVKRVGNHLLKQHAQATSPTLAAFREFPGTYQLYAKRHFELPKFYIYLNALVKLYGLGVSPNTNVAAGKNGFFYEGWGVRDVEQGVAERYDNIADYMGQIPFSEEELRQWRRALEERSYWLREQGSEYVFVLAPTKAFVYPEFLPDPLGSIKGRTRYEQLTHYLKENAEIHFIDLLPALLSAKKEREYPLLFYKTDFHWNFYGAFIAYKTMVEGLRKFFPQHSFPLASFEDFTMQVDEHWAHERFMNLIGLPARFHKNEHYLTLVPKKGGLYDTAQDLPAQGIHDIYPPESNISAPDGSSMKIRLIRNPAAPLDSILLLGDSFMEKCLYFFSANARKVMNFRTVVNFPDKIFHYEQPDIVIQEILNMFILRPPPTNPPAFRQSFLRAKVKEPDSRVITAATPEMLTAANEKGKLELALPVLPEQGREALLVVELELATAAPLKVGLLVRDAVGQLLQEESLQPGGKAMTANSTTTIYGEIKQPGAKSIELKLQEPGAVRLLTMTIHSIPENGGTR